MKTKTSAKSARKSNRPRNAIAVKKPQPGNTPTRFVVQAASKIYVDNLTALGVATCFACLRVVSETIGILTHKQYEMRPNGRGRDLIVGDFVDRLLRISPNPEISPIDWRVAMTMCAMLGDGYSIIERSISGDPIGMWPMHPSRVSVKRSTSDRLFYEVIDDGGTAVPIAAEDMFHIKGPTFDGMAGIKIIDLARESFGMTVAADQFGSSFYGNAARPSAVVEIPETMSDPAYRRFRKSMTELYAGVKNAGRIAILEEGAKFNPITMQPDEAQYIETRKYQIREVCRWFRVPPHKVADLEDAHFTNIEHQEIEFVTDTILPWAVRFEQEANRKLIASRMRDRRYTKINVDGLLRGDAKSRNEAYRIAREAGWRNANEIRALEDENPIDEPWAEKYWMPMNYMYADEPRPESGAERPSEPSGSSEATEALAGMIAIDAMRPTAMKLVQGAFDTAWRKEEKARARAVKSDGFAEWSVEFYATHCGYITSLLGVVADAFLQGLRGGEFPQAETMCRVFAERYTTDAMRQERDAWAAWTAVRRVTDTADFVDQLFAMAQAGRN